MNEDNQTTIDAYNQGVAEYNNADTPEVIGDVKRWVDTSLAMLPDGAIILEIGSARGRDAAYMESTKPGVTVDRTDAAEAFVTYMQEQGYDARVLNALTDEYGGPYNMVYANAVLLHFNGDQIATVLDRIRDALVDNGIFSFSVKIGEGTAWSDSKLNSPRYFTYWQEEPIRQLLAEHQFEVVFWEEAQTGHDNSDWYHVITRKL